MLPLLFDQVFVDEVHLPLLQKKNIRISVLRIDKIHPVISGNKWFKLKYFLEDAKTACKKKIVTFGGAYSNHIVATSAAGKMFGFKTAAVIRGEKPEKFSYSLQQAKEYGMELFFTSRKKYRKKMLPSELSGIDDYIIPEGGYGILGALGAAEIFDLCEKKDFRHIACAVGTATMMAGLIKSCLVHQIVVGISVMKNNLELDHQLLKLLPTEDLQKKFFISHEYHFGGYAKYTDELINFMNEFYLQTSIPLDFVYTAKLFYGVIDMLKKGQFKTGSRILLIHSGGLQGNLSLKKGTLIY
jgi:1-aminocyclopropane-1-carboxylate deaminase